MKGRSNRARPIRPIRPKPHPGFVINPPRPVMVNSSSLTDDLLIRKKKHSGMNKIAEKITDIKLKLAHSKISREQLAKGPSSEIPMIVSVKTGDIDSEEFRQSLDLVILIDVSGSMSGQKIELVKDTLLFIIDELTEFDRLSFVVFSNAARRLTGFKSMTQLNKIFMKNIVKEQIKAGGGTNIKNALEVTYASLLSRTQWNDVTSVFLLSDGCDTYNNAFQIGQSLNQGHQNMKDAESSYTMHSFGYGSDHDEKILTLINEKAKGNFYYIKQLSYVDECFIDCFGYLLSIFGRKPVTEIMLKMGIEVKRVASSNLTRNTSRTVSVNIGDLALEKTYQYLMFISFNSKKMKLDQNKLTIGDLEMEFQCEGETIWKNFELELEIVDKDSQLGPEDIEVEEEVQKAEAKKVMQLAKKKLDEGNYKESKQIFSNYKNQLNDNSRVSSNFKYKMSSNLKMENLESNKDFYQVNQIFSNANTYVPTYENFTKQNRVQKCMAMKRKK